MTTTVLTDEQISDVGERMMYGDGWSLSFARAIEQAVLQSPEIQALRKDAERYRFMRNTSCEENEALLNKAVKEIKSRIPEGLNAPRYEDYDAGIDAAMEKRT